MNQFRYPDRILTVLLSCACIAALIGVLALSPAQANRSETVDVWFFDQGTGKLFTAGANKIPPIEAPSDAEHNENAETDEDKRYNGVRAMVFSCNDCRDSTTHFVGYLERYTPEAKAAAEKWADGDDPEAAYELMESGREIRLVSQDEWLAANTKDAMAIYEQVRGTCNEQDHPRQCFPRRAKPAHETQPDASEDSDARE